MSIEDLVAAEAEASDRDRDAPLKPGTVVSRGHSRSRTLQVRLNEREFDTLSALAEKRGLPISTVARDLLLGQLSAEGESPAAMIARMRTELDALAAVVS